MPSEAQLLELGGAWFAPEERWRGHVVVVDFWASWCAECVRVVPQVRRLATAFADAGLIVVGLNVGETEAQAREAATRLAITYPIALDPQLGFANLLGASQLPLVLVIDRDGSIVFRGRRVDGELLRVVRQLLAKPL